MQAAKQCNLLDWNGGSVVRPVWVEESLSTTAPPVAAPALALCDAPTAAAVSRATDTDAATENSQTSTSPAVAATAAASADLRNSWMLAFPLFTAPTKEWVSAIKQSDVEVFWLSTMISNYATLRHLLLDSVDRQGLRRNEAFHNCGVTSNTDKRGSAEMGEYILADSAASAASIGRGSHSCF